MTIINARSVHASSAPCSFLVAGLDTTHYNWSFAPFLGHALGQTFYAPETLITKITVWRPPGDHSPIGAHLYVTAVDSTSWIMPFPDTRHILLDGPTIRVYDSDPPGGFIEMPFVIDPPLALPARGRFAWFVQPEACHQAAVWYLCLDTLNNYPDGILWWSARATDKCYLAPAQLGEEDRDYIFQIEFCDVATPTRRRTWGQLKLLYR